MTENTFDFYECSYVVLALIKYMIVSYMHCKFNYKDFCTYVYVYYPYQCPAHKIMLCCLHVYLHGPRYVYVHIIHAKEDIALCSHP